MKKNVKHRLKFQKIMHSPACGPRDFEIFWIMSGSEIGVFRVYGGSSAAPSAALLASSAAVAAACINCKAQNDTQSPNMFHYALYN